MHLKRSELAENDIAILPVGSYEQHGPHLPMTSDLLIAEEIARRVGGRLGATVLPALPFSCSQEHAPFGADVSLRPSTLEAFVEDVLLSGGSTPIRFLALLSWHGGNRVLTNIVRTFKSRGHKLAVLPIQQDRELIHSRSGCETNARHDLHAGELETSMLLHLRPEVVGTLSSELDRVIEFPDIDNFGFSMSDNGVAGCPSFATASKGKAAFEAAESILANRLREYAEKREPDTP